MIKLLVFDFDGTLADSRKEIIKILNETFKKFNCKIPAEKIKRELGNKTLQKTLWSCRIESGKISKVISYSNALEVIRADKIKLSLSVKKLNKIKIKKIIMTNNTQKFAEAVLAKNKIKFFAKIYGAESFRDKASKLTSILKSGKIKPSQVVYVGDKRADITLARKVKCISVILVSSASWSPKKEILKAKPDFVISNLSQLSGLIKKLNSSA